MPLAELKTKATGRSVTDFIDAIDDDKRRRDCRAVHEIMRRVTRVEPKMWGSAIVGYGDQHYRYATGREGDWFLVGFSPRKQSLTLYLTGGLGEAGPLLEKLGKHTTGKGCLYIGSLTDVHVPTLEKLIAQSVRSGLKAHAAAIGEQPSKRSVRAAGAARAKAKSGAKSKTKSSASRARRG